MAAFKNYDNGTWYVQFRYTDWRGERQQKLKRGFTTKKEAQAWEREFLQQKTADVNMTFDEKWKYKTHGIELNEFCRLFHALTKQCLVGMVSVLGSLEGKKTNEPLYESCRLGFIVDDFRIEFDRMYVAFLDG